MINSNLTRKIYDKSPILLQNLFVSLMGLRRYLLRYGKEFERYHAQIEESQWYSATELRELQNEKLKNLIEYVYQYVPYYRERMEERKLTPRDITRVEDLVKLPFLTKEDVRINTHKLIATNADKKHLLHSHTSGTTGKPLEFYQDKTIWKWETAFIIRHWGWANLRFRDKAAILRGWRIVDPNVSAPPFWRFNQVENHLLLSSYHLTGANLKECVRILERFQPVFISCYPSTGYILARYMNENGICFPLKAIITSSETLHKFQREELEKAFDCQVFDWYGLAENVATTQQCSIQSGYHQNSEYGIIEFVQGDSLAPEGEMGEIVATGLNNYVMPFIRYRTGDISAPLIKKCSCGRGLPLMSPVTTKQEDMIVNSDGQFISSSVLTYPFKDLYNIKECQIVQEDFENLTIKVVRRKTYSESDTKMLLDGVKKCVGKMQINIEFVDEIERTSAGKFRWVVSKVPLEERWKKLLDN